MATSNTEMQISIPVIKTRYFSAIYVLSRVMQDSINCEVNVSFPLCSETECVFECYNSNYFINVRLIAEGGPNIVQFTDYSNIKVAEKSANAGFKEIIEFLLKNIKFERYNLKYKETKEE